MSRQAGSRATVSVFAALCVSLLVAAFALAAPDKPPSLASTSQYKAFVEYVKKLDGLVGQPTSSAQKETYEAELTTKGEAASHKANALFNRKSEEAKAQSNAKFKAQKGAIQLKEEEELGALRAEFGGKVERATASYQEKLDRVETGRHNFEASTNEQIAGLRGKKAEAKEVGQKEAIQARITVKIEKIAAKRAEAKEKRTVLKAGFGKQKEEIHAGQAKKETEVGEAAAAKIEKSSQHWKQLYLSRRGASKPSATASSPTSTRSSKKAAPTSPRCRRRPDRGLTTPRVLVTDHAWPSLEIERAHARGGRRRARRGARGRRRARRARRRRRRDPRQLATVPPAALDAAAAASSSPATASASTTSRSSSRPSWDPRRQRPRLLRRGGLRPRDGAAARLRPAHRAVRALDAAGAWDLPASAAGCRGCAADARARRVRQHRPRARPKAQGFGMASSPTRRGSRPGSTPRRRSS